MILQNVDLTVFCGVGVNEHRRFFLTRSQFENIANILTLIEGI